MPTIRYRARRRVLVAVRGHPFDRTAFDAIFQAMEGVSATMVDQPAAAQLMNPAGMADYEALVLYDMPGLDFDAPQDKPGRVDPGDALRQGFEALLHSGKGVVALHHALAGWPAWPAYAEILGGAFLYRPATVRGRLRPDSGYRHAVAYTADVLAPEHPVMAGVPASFPMTDELYLGEVFTDAVTPLLKARRTFAQEDFYSAAAAMEGRMFDNQGWSHDEGSDLIGWTLRAHNSRVVYLQPGDDKTTYDNPVYRRLVENAIHWVAAEGT